MEEEEENTSLTQVCNCTALERKGSLQGNQTRTCGYSTGVQAIVIGGSHIDI